MPFLDHDGKLAFTFGWQVEQDRPIESRHIHVSKARASDWPHLLDPPVVRQQMVWDGNTCIIHFLDRRPTMMDTTDWERVIEEKPVKKPRRGKRQGQAYDWEWQRGQWVRKWL